MIENFINNVVWICKDRHIKKGILERNVEVSAGYLSRIIKNENAGLNVVTAYKIAHFLGEKLDDLLTRDYEAEIKNKLKQEEIYRLKARIEELENS